MENINNTPVIEPLYSGDGRQLYPITHIKAIIGGDGAITIEKLSPELQESIAKIATLETRVAELETKIQELLKS